MYIGLAMFISLKILFNIGYRNIGKISYRCNTTINYGLGFCYSFWWQN